MHTIPPTVLEEMLASHAMGAFPDWNLSFFGVRTEHVLARVVEMFDQPGGKFLVTQVCGPDWWKETNSPNEALEELARRGTRGNLNFQVSFDDQLVFERSSWLTFDEQTANVELVFFEQGLDLIHHPKLWHRMVEYACHAARVAGARGVLIHDGSASAADMGSMIDGDEPSCPDRVIWLDR